MHSQLRFRGLDYINTTHVTFSPSTVDEPNPDPMPAANPLDETNSLFSARMTAQPETFNELCVEAWRPLFGKRDTDAALECE